MASPSDILRCDECGAEALAPARISYDTEKNYDGRLYPVHVDDLPVLKCGKCGEVYFDREADERIADALRAKLGLLGPGEIRESLRGLHLTQTALASRLGVAAETVSRWVNGTLIQGRAMDNLMRLYFTVPEARARLTAWEGAAERAAHRDAS